MMGDSIRNLLSKGEKTRSNLKLMVKYEFVKRFIYVNAIYFLKFITCLHT